MVTRLDFSQRRHLMVEQLQRHGIVDRNVLDAMGSVPREMFVSDAYRNEAYADDALPIDANQTISQPLIVASMAETLNIRPDDQILEIGAGSGYAAAVMSRVAMKVYAIERQQRLVAICQRRLASLGFDNVLVRHADGIQGWPELAPFDGISIAAATSEIPLALMDQLAIGRCMVLPLETPGSGQELVRVTRTGTSQWVREFLCRVRFVPLLGGVC